MRIAVVQTQPVACAIDVNVKAHETWVKKAAAHGADMVFFPELSLTGYEPKHAQRLVLRGDEARLDVFQMLSHALRITIGVGAPTLSLDGVRISMLVFRPDAARIVYSKQHLHADERAYFVAGDGQVTLASGTDRVAPAICYESLLDEHCAQAVALGANLYVASVAKSAKGVAKAAAHYPAIARRHSLPVLMANCVGACDGFEAAGGSAVWSAAGEMLGCLPATGEGALLFDSTARTAAPVPAS
ncbi:MAG TPA: carbon-nitrogen hydrolase family protein [Gammaproteobacteria bacterium]|nr:carbon-nitrogen hydrolase family protein [Gammaproteobacteria bacterium]